MAQALGCKEKASMSWARTRSGLPSACPGPGTDRVLYFHSDPPLPHGSQHLGLQPFSPVSSADHNYLWERMGRVSLQPGLLMGCGGGGFVGLRAHEPLQYLFAAPASRRERSFLP